MRENSLKSFTKTSFLVDFLVHPVTTSIQRMGTGSTGQSVDLDRKFMAVFIASCLGLNFSDSGLWTRAVQQCGEGGWQDQRRRQFT